MAGFDPSPVVRGLESIRLGLRSVRDEAALAHESLKTTTTAAAVAVEETRGNFVRLIEDLTALDRGTAQVRRGLDEMSPIAEEAVRTMSARSEEVEHQVRRVRETVDTEAARAEESTRRVREAVEETGQRTREVAAEVAGATGGLLDQLGTTNESVSALLASFGAMQESVPPQLRGYIALSEGMFDIVARIKQELDVLRDQVKTGALDLGEIVERLGQLQTFHAQRILRALEAVKAGGRNAIRELEQALSEARRLGDTAESILAAGLDDLLDDARRNGQL